MRPRLPLLAFSLLAFSLLPAAILGLALIVANAPADAQAAGGRGVVGAGGGGGGVPGAGAPGGGAPAPVVPVGVVPGGGPAGGAPGGGAPRLPTGPLFGLDGTPPVPGAGGQPQNQAPHDPDLLVVVFRAGTPDGTTTGFAGAFNLTIERQYLLAGLRLRVILMRIPAGGNFDDVLRRAAADQRPLWVQPDFRYQSLESTTGAAVGTSGRIGSPAKQYALQCIHAEGLPKAARGQGITVALIDSGVQRDHELLKGDHVTVIDVVTGDEAVPAETHGTVLASIIAGSGKVQGLAPAVNLLAIRAFAEVDPKSGASQSDSFRVSQGVSVALEHQARIINLSIGGPNDRLVRAAIEEAVLTGVVVIAAAGNNGPDAPPVYPAAQTGVIAVTATDAKDHIFDGANQGDYIAVAAPGVDVLAARPGAVPGSSAYDYFTGTSMATGYVTGLAAVLLSADPKLNSAALRHILESSATDLGAPQKDPEFGWGRIDAASAFAATPSVGAAN